MSTVEMINLIIMCVFLLCYSYQFVYIPIGLLTQRKYSYLESRGKRVAVLIAARNEQAVIGELIDSIREQDYPQQLIDIIVGADNCTDRTAETARGRGARVFERQDTEHVGKGYVLNFLLYRLQTLGLSYDAYIVLDADNILDPGFIAAMCGCAERGHDIVTCYRNSKNYGDNWLSAGIGLWFLRESRYLNGARAAVGSSCAVSGTGFLFTRRILERCGGWRFFLLTEDIEFTIDNVTGGVKIGYCPDAITYDEQPVTFRQSWRQRMRWSRGYMQVFARYGGRLLRGMLRGSFSCYDMAMSIMPAAILTGLSIVVNIGAAIANLVSGGDWAGLGTAVWQPVAGLYLTLFAVGAITTLSEWKNIRCTAAKKVLYAFTFPLFMLTFVPICIAAMFKNPGWQPILHTRTLADLSQAHRRCPDTAKAANVTGM